MKIGELSKLTGVPSRLLRYYEEQDLLHPDRGPNGYRDYPEAAVDRVHRVRDLLDAGIPTRVIRDLIPCMPGPDDTIVGDGSPRLVATLSAELDDIDRRIDVLTRNRDAIARYLHAVAALTHKR